VIEEGTAIAEKTIGAKKQKVLDYKAGDYFGELALLNSKPRAASIKATSKLKLMSIDKASFKRLLGPLEEILKRNMQKYISYMA
jgi:cAMP-dependent protein kinase regulator